MLAAVLVAMAAMFVAALAVPEAFGRHGVLFGVAFLIVRVMHLTLYALSARPDRDLFEAILRIAPSSLVGAALILVAGFVEGGLKSALWVVALVVGFLGPLVSGVQGWRLAAGALRRAARADRDHRDRRVPLRDRPRRREHRPRGRRDRRRGARPRRRDRRSGSRTSTSSRSGCSSCSPSGAEPTRIALARDVYTYLHLPMVAGIVLFAFAMEVTLAHVGSELDTLPAFALCAGPALYLLAFVALRLRVSRTLGRGRLVAAVACAALFPVALAVPALVALALVAAVWVRCTPTRSSGGRKARAEARALPQHHAGLTLLRCARLGSCSSCRKSSTTSR